MPCVIFTLLHFQTVPLDLEFAQKQRDNSRQLNLIFTESKICPLIMRSKGAKIKQEQIFFCIQFSTKIAECFLVNFAFLKLKFFKFKSGTTFAYCVWEINIRSFQIFRQKWVISQTKHMQTIIHLQTIICLPMFSQILY